MPPSCFSLFKPKSRRNEREFGSEKKDSLSETLSTVSTLVPMAEDRKFEEKEPVLWAKVDTSERLKEIRALMKELGIDY